MAEVKITKEMLISEIIRVKPETVPVFGAFGMGCIHCLAADSESVEEAAMVHGISVEGLLDALNRA